MNTKSKGGAYERRAKALLEDEGYLVTKAGGSLGEADLVALKAWEPTLLVQVKATKGGPYEHFRPVERKALWQAAEKAGARCQLWWWEPGVGFQRLGPEDWPSY